MSKTLTAALILLGAATLTTPGQAQDLTAMYNNYVGQQDQYFRQLQGQMVQQNLSDPRVIAAYQAGACGYGLSPQQFAYKWAATGGCTVQGMQNYMNTSNQIAAQQQNAWQSYQQNRANNVLSMQNMHQGMADIRYQQGMQLGGWQYGYAPNGQVIWYR